MTTLLSLFLIASFLALIAPRYTRKALRDGHRHARLFYRTWLRCEELEPRILQHGGAALAPVPHADRVVYPASHHATQTSQTSAVLRKEAQVAEAAASAQEALDYARLAAAAYTNEAPPGWRIAWQNEDPATGFRGVVYLSQDGTRSVLAFRGTELNQGPLTAVLDITTDLVQPIEIPLQYEEARKMAADAKQRYGNTLVVVGHSKGAGEAAYAGLANGLRTDTFNGAGLGLETRAVLFLEGKLTDANIGLVHNYNTIGDPLSNLGNFITFSPQFGHQHSLPVPGLHSPIDAHDIGQIVQYLERLSRPPVYKLRATVNVVRPHTRDQASRAARHSGNKAHGQPSISQNHADPANQAARRELMIELSVQAHVLPKSRPAAPPAPSNSSAPQAKAPQSSSAPQALSWASLQLLAWEVTGKWFSLPSSSAAPGLGARGSALAIGGPSTALEFDTAPISAGDASPPPEEVVA
jgi:hypothetical protein